MATEYGDDIKQAAKTLHIEGLSSAAIKERLANGNAGLPFKVDPAERTIDGWRKAWKKDGIRAGLMVREGDEDQVENAIYRRLLGVVRLKVQQLEDQAVAGTPDLALAKEVGVLQSVIDTARAKRQTIAKRAKGQPTTPEEMGELGGQPISMLDKLASEEPDPGNERPGQDAPSIESSTEGGGSLSEGNGAELTGQAEHEPSSEAER